MFNKLKQIKNNYEEKQLMKRAEILKNMFEEEKQRKRNYYLSKFKNVMLTDELQKWVDEDERRTIEAVNRGEKCWLWDTKEFISKLYYDAVEMCQVFEKYQFLALYVGVIAKFITDEEVLNVFKRWFYTDEVEYNKEFFGYSIYMLAHRYHDHPITALFRAYSVETGQVPYPAYLNIEDIYTSNSRYCRNFNVYMKKISDDGLHLVECSEYDYNEAIGDHYANMTDEEKEIYWREQDEIFQEKLKDVENINKLKAAGLL